ncbi:MAG: SDR family oxidoreductase [Chromatiales bacterium]|jgi:NAD(P)-dependent dehydrogenase (short-subunit alcohol dehydrogenase family)|nr:SDR family oxidoreductase [Chromatiales bacterium]
MTGRLVGRKAVVTGGATGIGRAIAAAFLREGAAVVVADINGSAAALAARELAPLGTVHAVCCDVTQSGAVGELAAAAVDRLGSVNVLVNNAGLSGRGLITDISEERIDALLAVNLKGVILCAQAFAPVLADTADGAMINMSSQAGKRGWSELSVYGATKAGVLGMNRALAVELAPRVRVNAICPGYISDVGMAWRGWETHASNEGGTTAEVGARFAVENIPLGRLQSADDIANTAVFLAGDEAREITGAAINVGGGVVMD